MNMLSRWKTSVAVITGASSGIGAATAEELVKSGLTVVGLARRSERVDKLALNLIKEEGKLYSIKADITKEVDIINAFNWISKNLGPIHILINNAGVLHQGGLTTVSTDVMKQVFDTNVIGLCIATREAIKNMQKYNVDGHIIHLNSFSGHRVAHGVSATHNVYPASKFAVTALTETLRQELNSMGSKIKISSVSPGYVATEMANPEIALQPQDVVEAIKYMLSTPPHVQVHDIRMKAVGQPF